MVSVPITTVPVIPAGSLSATTQPSLSSTDGELLLRPWDVRDAAAVYTAYQDPAIRHWHARHMSSLDEAREWIEVADRSWQQEQRAQWAIVRAGSGEVLGRTALGRFDLHQGLARCGYWVLPEARGTGVAPRALAAVADWALRVAEFHRVDLEHSVRNEASCRVALKAGFALEGTRRSVALHTDGWHDMHQHARVHGDP
ncbi:GNAT family N-acetyltransferase [Streptomyces sp. B6B3]|uniref:GNAT family N-acetyltransferase n=1 Tax=Streptomyces sp. B6B3 TaxID=3153570 RepID=UPI00325E0BD0